MNCLHIVSLGLIAALAGCMGEITGERAACEAAGNAQPAAPSIQSPQDSRLDLTAGPLVITTSAFSDADPADTHLATEIELWTAGSDGSRAIRVWSALVDDPARLTSVTLDDGAFDSADTTLAPLTRFIVRARHRDSSDSCSDWSEWSQEQAFGTDDESNYLFNPDQVHTIYLTIPPESWDAIDQEARPPGCEPHVRNYYGGAVQFEDQVFENAGIRIKGGCGSARHLDQKSGFKINLSWDDPSVPECPETRRLYGLKRITLNNMVQDRTFLHETLGYAFYKQMGVPTPRTGYMRVYVNDELFGFYLHQETIDRRFVSRWFERNDGMMYEGTYWCDLIPENIPPDLEGLYCFSRKFGTGACSEPSDFELLRQLIETIAAIPDGRFYPEVEQFFDFDTLLSSWAVDSVLAHWDGYEFRIMNNYRVYLDPARNRWTIVPTGIDQTFRDDQDPWDVSGVLALKCLDDPECEAAFAARLHEAVDTFERMNLAGRAQQLRALITPHVMEDPRKEIGMDQFNNQVDQLLQWIADRPARVREILTSRGF